MTLTRVAICDDSRTYVHALTKVLEADGDITVVGAYGTAEELLAALPGLKADLVTMDLELPGLDGVDATRRILATRPLPVVVLSSHADERAAEALAAGAVDVLPKGEVLLGDAGGAGGMALRRRIRRLSRLQVSGPPAPRRPTGRIVARPDAPLQIAAARGVRAIGVAASTGGPSALRAVLGALPADPDVPVFVVQHMTAGFTEGLARWLDSAIAAPVRLARDGVVARPGVWLAPDEQHLTIEAGLVMRLDRRDRGGLHRPSANALLCSMAVSLGSAAVAVVLTGMGDDGAKGVAALVGRGALVIAQDAASAVVAGMPRAAAAAGAQLILSLDEIGAAIAALHPARLVP
jgi:two-component system chemotaxis response regulator CheB